MTNTVSDALLACLFAFVFGATATAQTSPASRTPLSPAQAAEWREDLRYMAAEMAKRHKNLYHSVSKERFEGAVAVLDERIPSLARHQVIVEMARIAALVGDGHTNIAPTRDPKIGFRSLPVRFYLFKDGLFIRAARKGEGTLAGTGGATGPRHAGGGVFQGAGPGGARQRDERSLFRAVSDGDAGSAPRAGNHPGYGEGAAGTRAARPPIPGGASAERSRAHDAARYGSELVA